MFRGRDFVERFWSKVSKGVGCWSWTGGIDSSGYGVIVVRSIRPRTCSERAHRVAWMLFFGDPGSLCVLHRCDNRVCVRPDHLFIGTRHDNNTDRERKGRSASHVGELNESARLTESDVRSIRASRESIACLMARYGVCKSMIGHIRSRRNWKHIQ
jgi:hypothetical protein